VSTAKIIISTPDLSEFITEPLQHFSVNLSAFENAPLATNSQIAVVKIKELPVATTYPPPAKATVKDLAVLVYTSGTTGKPKACACRNMLLMTVSNPHPYDTQNPKKYFPLRT